MVKTLFYHYTSHSGYNKIKNAQTVSGRGSYLTTDDKDDDNEQITWNCRISQPQKNLRHDEQHSAGFYMTKQHPSELNSTTTRKTGIAGAHNDDSSNFEYVFVFCADVGRRKPIKIGDVTVEMYPGTLKYYMKGKEGQEVRIGPGDGIWCGPKENCPALNQLQQHLA